MDDDGKVCAALRARGEHPLAFAVWNGANDERDSFKAVTLSWQLLRWRR